MSVRERITELEKAPDKLALLRDAFLRFQSRSDDTGYNFFASLHGLPLPAYCEHGSRLFLPWHRAYLYYFELGLQTRLGPNFTVIQPQIEDFKDVSLPWWDWSSQIAHSEGIPKSYTKQENIQNPLASAHIGWPVELIRQVRRHPRLRRAITRTGEPRTLRRTRAPQDLPTRNTIDNIIQTQRTYGRYNDAIEQVHGDVHVWVGGSMGEVPAAAFDPIFWSHHAMIDKLWSDWQKSPLGENPESALLNRPLAPFPMTVNDTLDLDGLNIEYVISNILVV